MKILVIFLLFIVSISFSQIALIQDKDGYTNVREKPEINSKVIHKVYENEIFWFDLELFQEGKEWIPVSIPKNDFSLDLGLTGDLEGYIHRSRLKPLSELELYTKTNIIFRYTISPFDSTDRIVDKSEGKWITEIDGRPVWGTDGNFPKKQVANIKVIINGQDIPINRVFYSDLFECHEYVKIYKNTDCYFVYQANSDGAGSYEVVFVFTDKGLKQRLVGRAF